MYVCCVQCTQFIKMWEKVSFSGIGLRNGSQKKKKMEQIVGLKNIFETNRMELIRQLRVIVLEQMTKYFVCQFFTLYYLFNS